MPFASILNTDQLLAPISEEQPTGPNVHGTEDPDHYNAVTRIKMRYFFNAKDWQNRFNQSLLRGKPRPEQNDSQSWQTVVDYSTTCLTTKSKDLWVCAYLLVALTYRHGFFGLRDGLKFLTELVSQYGIQLHPNAQPLIELRQTVPNIENAVQLAPLSDPAHGARCRLDFIIANDISTFGPEQLAPYLELDTPLSEQLKSDLSESEAEYLQQVAEVVKECEQALDAFAQVIRTQFPSLPNPNDYPNYDSVRKELRNCHGLIVPYLKAASADAPEAATGDTAGGPMPTDGVIQNRENALRKLEEIAAYFERIEPLSPLPYVIRRAVSWGKKSLPEVLAELLSEEERNKLRERAGIPLHFENAAS